MFPTYVVHVYHDTGRSITRDTRTYRELEPQSSFGYYVYHEEANASWSPDLTGATEIIEDTFYLLAVPEGGSATVGTRVEAFNESDNGCGAIFGGGPALAVGLFGLLVPLVRRRRKQDSAR